MFTIIRSSLTTVSQIDTCLLNFYSKYELPMVRFFQHDNHLADRKRFWKRSDGAASSEESGELKRGLLMEDLENEHPTSFGYDRKRRSEPSGSWSSDSSEEI